MFSGGDMSAQVDLAGSIQEVGVVQYWTSTDTLSSPLRPEP